MHPSDPPDPHDPADPADPTDAADSTDPADPIGQRDSRRPQGARGARRDGGRRALGALGEQLAAAHLERAGYRILARNERAGGVEIDLIALAPGGVLVVAEVKTRRGRRLGLAEEAVDRRKQARLVRGAAHWLAGRRRRFARVRFDVLRVEAHADGRFSVHHLPGAFDAGCD